MLVPAAPRPSRLSATPPPMFFFYKSDTGCTTRYYNAVLTPINLYSQFHGVTTGCMYCCMCLTCLIHAAGFSYFRNFCKNSKLSLQLRRHAKFGEDRTMPGRVIAYFRFSKWRPSAILDLVWRHGGQLTTCVWWSWHSSKIIARWSC